MLRYGRSILVIVMALALVVGLSVVSVYREQRTLTDDFASATKQQIHASAEALTARLDALDQDTRMLTDLVERSSSEPPREGGRSAWESAFQALVVVVAQYRYVALIDRAGTIEVSAVDPSEPAATVDALTPHVRAFGQEVSSRSSNALGDTARIGDRSYFLYGAPVHQGRSIVVAMDAATFLGAVAWTPLSAAELYVTDPAGQIWAGCETPTGCQARDAVSTARAPHVQPPKPPAVGPRGGRLVLPPSIPAVAFAERIDRPTGSWTITCVASTRPIIEREASMVSRVVIAAMAAAVAVALVGAFVLRQQRTTVELEGQLQYARALASARETSQAIVENAPLGVIGLSQEGRVVLANRFLVDRLGPIRIGAPLADAFEGAESPWVRALERLLASSDRDSGEYPVLGSIAAGTRELRVRIVPVHNGELGVHTFALVEDQTELKDLEQQLVRAEKLITVGVLSAGIAHEIGTPLGVIRGRAEQVLRSVADPRRAEDLRVIVKHIDSISSTLRQVLDFSRRQPIVRQPVALDAVVERARGLLQWKLEAKHLEVGVRLEDDLPMLAADSDQLQQVLVNLLLNACDASTERQSILVTARSADDGGVEIEVADRGHGIPPELLNAVFDPFFTTKKRGEGTGLGLSIAASIVRNHGGRIDLASTPDQGTTVTVSWPAAPAASVEEARAGA